MKEPTNEEKKEFWEWCGLRIDNDQGQLYIIDRQGYPNIHLDLNSLFKYAKDAVIKKYGKKEWHRILHEWINSFASSLAEDVDPALALFRILKEVSR